MTIELTPELEEILKAESSATGLSPAEITLRLLTIYAHSRPQFQSKAALDQTISASDLPSDPDISPEVLQQRREAGKRLFALRDRLASRGVSMPDEPAVRDWLHEEHRF